uniref:AB hydrolase-1 domain-containing protein n=1 Tax=Timema shepardi TaxID=629360 RepID=A0A7R9FVI8_TIMSH|nr:unnamed protein product [Timema shepardi]
MGGMKKVIHCIFGPSLYRVYSDQSDGIYKPGHLEKWGDQIINSLVVMWNVGIYTSPFLATVLWRRGYFVIDGVTTIAKFLTGIGLVIAVSYYLRGVGRASNPVYTTFFNTFLAAKKNLTRDNKRALMMYDFEYSAWPVEFKCEKKGESRPWHPPTRRSALAYVMGLPCHVASYIVAHTFGLKLVYPGSISMLQYAMSKFLVEGRMKLVKEHSGERFKLQTLDGNEIDSMFIDKRNRHENGNILVVCAEGNAGFYEIGVMVTPIEANYSVLGYNHPGFGGSTGTPYPDQEQNAIDAVMQFAIQRLNFLPENIILFGWSIGGYSTSWAAAQYPKIRGLILDATFDDVLPLAILKMPQLLAPIVRTTIREYINLNNYQLLTNYPGPVLIVRRTEDEVICTEESNLSTNRGNNLLVKLLRYRFPEIVENEQFTLLHEYLSLDTQKQGE